MNSENNNEVMSIEQIAKVYTEVFAGKMDQSLIDENVQALKSMITFSVATLHISPLLLYAKVDIDADTDNKRFSGHAIGQFLTKPAFTVGSIITNNASEMYRDTSAFTISFFAAGVSGVFAYFHNSHLKLLGGFVGAGIGIGEGTGAGPGKWK